MTTDIEQIIIEVEEARNQLGRWADMTPRAYRQAIFRHVPTIIAAYRAKEAEAERLREAARLSLGALRCIKARYDLVATSESMATKAIRALEALIPGQIYASTNPVSGDENEPEPIDAALKDPTP